MQKHNANREKKGKIKLANAPSHAQHILTSFSQSRQWKSELWGTIKGTVQVSAINTVSLKGEILLNIKSLHSYKTQQYQVSQAFDGIDW